MGDIAASEDEDGDIDGGLNRGPFNSEVKVA